MNLDKYLQRIGFDGDTHTDLESLSSLLQAHVCAVPFENVDVQLGRPLTLSVSAAYEKIVTNNRGGWCYEQNGLFGWALTQIGFEVTRLGAAVMRQARGPVSSNNHLCLRVGIPGEKIDFLVDVGFGGSMFEPIRLEPGEHRQSPFHLRLEMLDDGHWRFTEDSGSGPFSFDFLPVAGDEAALARRCAYLQNDPSSGFVQNLVVQLRTPRHHKSLRGRVFKVVGDDGVESRTLDSAGELVELAAREFGLTDAGLAKLWPRIAARHQELFADGNSERLDKP